MANQSLQDKEEYVKLLRGAGNMAGHALEQFALKSLVKNDVFDMVKMVPERSDLGVESALAEYIMDRRKVPTAYRRCYWNDMKNCALVVKTLRTKLNSSTSAFKKKYQRESHK
jgi:hypothetical protein